VSFEALDSYRVTAVLQYYSTTILQYSRTKGFKLPPHAYGLMMRVSGALLLLGHIMKGKDCEEDRDRTSANCDGSRQPGL